MKLCEILTEEAAEGSVGAHNIAGSLFRGGPLFDTIKRRMPEVGKVTKHKFSKKPKRIPSVKFNHEVHNVVS